MIENNFQNIMKNNELNNKIQKIISEKNYEKAYIECQICLEKINIDLLVNKMKIEMTDYDIARIIQEYAKIDKELYEQMISVNGMYNMVDQLEKHEEDVEYILAKIDDIYGYILEQYYN